MAPKKAKKTPAKPRGRPPAKTGTALKSAHKRIVDLDQVIDGEDDKIVIARQRDVKAQAMRAIKTKISPAELIRVLPMRVDGKSVVDLVCKALEGKHSRATRLGSVFWTPIFRSFSIKANPVAGLQVAGDNGEWSVAMVDALADCSSENACTRGHGLQALRCCLNEQEEMKHGALWGMLNTIFTLDVSSVWFLDKMLLVCLSWFCRCNRLRLIFSDAGG
jgi:hypothetical protein